MTNPHRIILCWVCEEERATQTMSDHPVCETCLDHFLPPQPQRQEYLTADVACDLRGL